MNPGSAAAGLAGGMDRREVGQLARAQVGERIGAGDRGKRQQPSGDTREDSVHLDFSFPQRVTGKCARQNDPAMDKSSDRV